MVSATSGALEAFNYTNYTELLDHIRLINQVYYVPVVKNIEYLEKSYHRSYLAHTVGLRDAHSHLAVIFEYKDILSPNSKNKIIRQLERYLGHLEHLLYDTYLKIIREKSKELIGSEGNENEEKIVGRLREKGRERDIPKMKMELAIQVQRMRMMDDKTPVEEKIENFKKISSFIEEAYHRL